MTYSNYAVGRPVASGAPEVATQGLPQRSLVETFVNSAHAIDCHPTNAWSSVHGRVSSPGHFIIERFSAGSYTGAVIALAIRCLWPQYQIIARLGAIAMPRGVLAALVATSDPDRHHLYFVHADADTLCDWYPNEKELQMLLQHNLHVTNVEESARWIGSNKHKYWYWLRCRTPYCWNMFRLVVHR